MTRNTLPRCPSFLPGIFLCASLAKTTFALQLALTLRPDASTLESSYEYCSDPSLVSRPCDRHMGVDLGFDRGKKRPHPALLVHALKFSRSDSSAKISPTSLSAVSSWVS